MFTVHLPLFSITQSKKYPFFNPPNDFDNLKILFQIKNPNIYQIKCQIIFYTSWMKKISPLNIAIQITSKF